MAFRQLRRHAGVPRRPRRVWRRGRLDPPRIRLSLRVADPGPRPAGRVRPSAEVDARSHDRPCHPVLDPGRPPRPPPRCADPGGASLDQRAGDLRDRARDRMASDGVVPDDAGPTSDQVVSAPGRTVAPEQVGDARDRTVDESDPTIGALRWLFAAGSVAYVVGIILQVLLAGAALFGMIDFTAHGALGWNLSLVPLLLLVFAALGQVGRGLILLTVALTLVAMLQPELALAREDSPIVAALHPVNALLLFSLAVLVARRAVAVSRLR